LRGRHRRPAARPVAGPRAARARPCAADDLVPVPDALGAKPLLEQRGRRAGAGAAREMGCAVRKAPPDAVRHLGDRARSRSMTDADISAARAAMDGFMEALNREDEQDIRDRWFHFPHVRFHSGKVTVFETPESYRSLVINRTGQASEWAR